MNYGVVLIPQGLPRHLTNFRNLLKELCVLDRSAEVHHLLHLSITKLTELHQGGLSPENVAERLSPWSASLFGIIPEDVKRGLLMDLEVCGQRSRACLAHFFPLRAEAQCNSRSSRQRGY